MQVEPKQPEKVQLEKVQLEKVQPEPKQPEKVQLEKVESERVESVKVESVKVQSEPEFKDIINYNSSKIIVIDDRMNKVGRLDTSIINEISISKLYTLACDTTGISFDYLEFDINNQIYLKYNHEYNKNIYYMTEIDSNTNIPSRWHTSYLMTNKQINIHITITKNQMKIYDIILVINIV